MCVLESGVFEVKATNGDTMLGGEDFTMRTFGVFEPSTLEGQQSRRVGRQTHACSACIEAAEGWQGVG
jgi:molecular chaperone DnaK (HSP70)